MCAGGGSPKVEVPKPPPLPPPLPPAPPPKPAPAAPKQLQRPDAKPDIRIGAAKRESSTQRGRNTQQSNAVKAALTIGTNQGLSI